MGDLVKILTLDHHEQANYIKHQLSKINIACQILESEPEQYSGNKRYKIYVEDEAVETAIHILLRVMKSNDQVPYQPAGDTRKVLLAVDFTTFSERSAEYAIGLADKLQAEINVLHIYRGNGNGSESGKNGSPDKEPETLHAAQKQMHAFYQKFESWISQYAKHSIAFTTTLMKGQPAKKILEAAQEYQPTVIVVGTRGKNQRTSKIVGDVTLKVIEQSPYPVITIPEGARFKGLDQLKILYATDFHESDFHALRNLLTLINRKGVQLFFVHIDLSAGDISKDARKMSHLNKQLQERFPDYKVESHLIASSNLLNGIQEFTDDYAIDLIAFTSPKKNIFDRLLKPNNLKRMVYQSHIPLCIFST